MIADFRNSMNSMIPGYSANPTSWCRLFGCRPKAKAINQMIVQEWPPTLPSMKMFIAQHSNFRLLIKVAANGTHQCESMICCAAFSPNLCGRVFDLQENGSGMSSTPAGHVAHSQLPAQGLKRFCFFFWCCGRL
jgi:hypothetical protein